jgi:release factor glutamine methyltransferase
MSSGDPTKEGLGSYRPLTSQERAERIWRWHTSAYRELSAGTDGDQTLCYLGRTLVAPSQVMPIVPMSHLLGEAVLSEVTEADRVLDMGTGSGVNAVLAASDRWRSWPWTSIPTRWRLSEITPCAMGVDRIEVRHRPWANQLAAAFTWLAALSIPTG